MNYQSVFSSKGSSFSKNSFSFVILCCPTLDAIAFLSALSRTDRLSSLLPNAQSMAFVLLAQLLNYLVCKHHGYPKAETSFNYFWCPVTGFIFIKCSITARINLTAYPKLGYNQYIHSVIVQLIGSLQPINTYLHITVRKGIYPL